MSDAAGLANPWLADTQSALALLELAVAERTARKSQVPITLPIDVVLLIKKRAWNAQQASAHQAIEEALLRAQDEVVELQLDVAKQIIDELKNADGQHRGEGRRRPPDSYDEQLRKKTIISFARRRKVELSAQKTLSADDAEEAAANEASQLARERYGIPLSTNTIRRRMQSAED